MSKIESVWSISTYIIYTDMISDHLHVQHEYYNEFTNMDIEKETKLFFLVQPIVNCFTLHSISTCKNSQHEYYNDYTGK